MYGDHSQDWLITSSLEPLRDGLEDCFLTWIDTTELQRPISLNGYQQPISSNGPWSPCPPIGQKLLLPEAISDTFCKNSRPNTPVISWHFGRMAPILCLLAVDQFWLALSHSCAARSTLRLWTLRGILRGASIAAEWLLRPCARKTVIGAIGTLGIAAGKATPHLTSTRLEESAWLYKQRHT